MNYYKRHLGDYAKDTKHLSLTEHGAFCMLLDYYYSTEKPIPDDRCERIANAYADFEREAVRSVLKEFFLLTTDGWVNVRADEIITEANNKSLKAKESAEARWNNSQSERNANASKSHSERNASHKPLAIKEKKEKRPAVADFFSGVPEQVASDFKALRKAKKAPITQTAVDGIHKEAAKAGMTYAAALAMCCERGWTGFKADWVTGIPAKPSGPTPPKRKELT